MAENDPPAQVFSFLKGGEDVLAPKGGTVFDWDKAAMRVRESLHDALNARHLSFLFGSGCSSLVVEDSQRGIDTMVPLAKQFLQAPPGSNDVLFPSQAECDELNAHLGFDLSAAEFAGNLERLMEVLYSVQFVLQRSSNPELLKAKDAVASVIRKVTAFVTLKCSDTPFAKGDQIGRAHV